MPGPMLHCDNCGQSSAAAGARFCARCGHALKGSDAGTDSPKDLASAALTAAGYHWTWPNTVWTVWTRPSVLLGDYLAGRRGRYVGPVKMLLAGIGVQVFLDSFLESPADIAEALLEFVPEEQQEGDARRVVTAVFAWPYLMTVLNHALFIFQAASTAVLARVFIPGSPRSMVQQLMIQSYIVGGFALLENIGRFGELFDSPGTWWGIFLLLAIAWHSYAYKGTLCRGWPAAVLLAVFGVIGSILILCLLLVAALGFTVGFVQAAPGPG